MRFILALLFASVAVAEIIPAARRITTWDQAGVSGGIEQYRTGEGTAYTQYGSTIASTGNTNDRAATIQAALNAASIGNYVLLGAGSFTVSTTLTIPNGVVLRGAGPTQTTITGAANPLIQFREYTDRLVQAISGSLVKGATSMTLTATPAILGIGMLVQIQEVNDARILAGIEQGGGAEPYAMGQWVKITQDSGAPTYTFSPALYADYPAANTPRARWNWLSGGGTSRSFVQKAGLEDLKVVNTNTNDANTVLFEFAEECWMYNVHSVDARTAHIAVYDSYRCEIRKCHLDNIIGTILSSRGYAMQTGSANSGLPPAKPTALLFVDNIVEKTRGGVVIGNGSSGCVVAYNYFTKMVSDYIYSDAEPETDTLQKMAISFHSSFPIMNLVEGNICTGRGLFADMDHGNSYWNTAARNWFKGKETGKTRALIAFGLAYQHRYWNAVGNVLGYSGIEADITAISGTSRKRAVVLTDTPGAQDFMALMLGYYGEGAGTTITDTVVSTSLAAHGNYDFVTTAGQSWEANNNNVTSYTDQTIPDSYFLASKPTWFGDRPWPANPANNVGALSDTAIPAGYRYVNGNEGYLGGTATQRHTPRNALGPINRRR